MKTRSHFVSKATSFHAKTPQRGENEVMETWHPLFGKSLQHSWMSLTVRALLGQDNGREREETGDAHDTYKDS